LMGDWQCHGGALEQDVNLVYKIKQVD
jgi:hypothetical protein